jgi:hypothetical protein
MRSAARQQPRVAKTPLYLIGCRLAGGHDGARYRCFVDAGVSDALPSTSEVELSSTMIEFGNILDRAEQTPQIFGAGNWISSVNCYRFRTAGHKTIPSAHRIEPTLYWPPGDRLLIVALCRSPMMEPDRSPAGFATSAAMVSASSPLMSALGVRSPPHRSGAMPRSLFATVSRASVNNSASAIGRSP